MDVINAHLNWQASTPVSQTFNDPYFSLVDAIAETEYVFIKHNHLLERWAGCQEFVIAETGFGTGLNFLITASHWLSQEECTGNLTYYSVEKYPLSREDLARVFLNWPQFQTLSAQILENYPDCLPGFHVLKFSSERITLILMIGDVLPMLQQLQSNVDCWYLDGFSPAKNPEMWTLAVCETMASLSKKGTSFSTFTAAGDVRRNLFTAGFEVKKGKGFGKKREMLFGSFSTNSTKAKESAPWFSLSCIKPSSSGRVAIVGGGLAGLTCAWMLTREGVDCTVIEAGDKIAVGASGNAAGIVMPRFSLDLNLESQYYISSFLFAIQCLNELKKQTPELSWMQSGVFQYSTTQRMARIAGLNLPSEFVKLLTQKEASDHAGIELTGSGVFFPSGGYLDPKQLCHVLSERLGSASTLVSSTKVEKVKRLENSWGLYRSDNTLIGQFDNIIFSNGFDAEKLLGLKSTGLARCRGQVSYLPFQTPASQLRIPVCDEGYLIPVMGDRQVAGATYQLDVCSLDLSLVDQQTNLENVESMLGLKLPVEQDTLSGRASHRTVSPDHLPLVGPVIDEAAYEVDYKNIHHGRVHDEYPDAEYLSGLFLSTGHGSRGLVSCFSAAAYLTELVCGKPLTIPNAVSCRLHPGRFKIRSLKKTPNRR